jgi:ankyrin repeat protein
MEVLRTGDLKRFRKLLRENPTASNGKGPGGATPLMYAALYTNSSAVRLLLEAGADPNLRDDGGATALMWAVPDLEKSKLLVEHGADVNAASDDARTPLLIASSWRNSSATLRLLLGRGANPNVKSPGGAGTPLAEAAYIADADAMRTLIEGGADLNPLGDPLQLALWSRCSKCVLSLAPTVRPENLVGAVGYFARLGDKEAVDFLLDHGADPNGRPWPGGPTVLIFAASSDAIPVGIVKVLLDRGSDPNAEASSGKTALHFAKLRGETPLVKLLLKAGARDKTISVQPVATPAPVTSARIAIQRSIPLLQRSDVTFLRKSGCVSCHNNSLTAMSVAAARKKGIPVNEQIAKAQLRSIAAFVETWRDRLLQNIGLQGDADGSGYILLGLAAENYPPDRVTDAAARFLASRQLADGSWRIVEHRPPLESSDIEVTAVAMRALQIYAPKAQRTQYDKAIQLAAAWLAKAHATTTEDRAFQLLGTSWAKSGKEVIRKQVRTLISEQRGDGGWGQLPTLASDAYATGQALVALMESDAILSADPAFENGSQFLLRTQLQDGSWYVKSRAFPFQPYFESDFPHGHDQWISAAGTNWATMALAFGVQ